MEKFTKITVGFVAQSYKKCADGKFVCAGQDFIAGDQIDYEDLDGNKITAPEYIYQSLEMTPPGQTEQQNKLQLGFLELQLLDACKVITSYTTDLLYRMDDQVDINDVEEIQQAKSVIEKYAKLTKSDLLSIECFISEQCSDVPKKKLSVSIMAENGKLWLGSTGYGDKTSVDGKGWPIGLEIWEGRLRLIVFDNINTEDPQIIDMEKAKEATRNKCSICNWCNENIDGEPVRYNNLLFCSDSCLDKCRAAQ